jgi:hypothetical protein
VLDFTTSLFHRPHVSSRAVAAKRITFISSSNPTGPKKYGNISTSPGMFYILPVRLKNFNTTKYSVEK